jgi:hypothetical protein
VALIQIRLAQCNRAHVLDQVVLLYSMELVESTMPLHKLLVGHNANPKHVHVQTECYQALIQLSNAMWLCVPALVQAALQSNLETITHITSQPHPPVVEAV